MFTFAEKPKAALQTASRSAIPGRSFFRPDREVNSIVHLQHTIGNQSVQRAVRDTVKETPASPAITASAPAANDAVPPVVHEVLQSPGRPMDSATRTVFEQRFDHDFSSVRVHTGERAAASAKAVNALAYTAGQHIVFGAGYAPAPHGEGGRLLSHELVHVMQWGSRPVPSKLSVGPADGLAERQAEAGAASSCVPTDSLQRAAVVCDEYGADETASATPATGIRINVDRVHKSADVNANLQVHGPEADATKTTTVRDAISTNWNGRFPDGFSINTNVSASYRAPGHSADTGASQIELVRAGADAPATTDQSAGSIWLNLDYSNIQLTWASAHEFGHLMGLRDRYSTDFWDTVSAFFGGERGRSIPDAGYENNIMGVHAGILESKNVRDLIALHIPYRCTSWRLEYPL